MSGEAQKEKEIRQSQSSRDQKEVKIQRIENGYLVKWGRGGWHCYHTLEEVCKHLESHFQIDPMKGRL